MNSQHLKQHSITRIHTQVPKRLLTDDFRSLAFRHQRSPAENHIHQRQIEMARSTKSCWVLLKLVVTTLRKDLTCFVSSCTSLHLLLRVWRHHLPLQSIGKENMQGGFFNAMESRKWFFLHMISTFIILVCMCIYIPISNLSEESYAPWLCQNLSSQIPSPPFPKETWRLHPAFGGRSCSSKSESDPDVIQWHISSEVNSQLNPPAFHDQSTFCRIVLPWFSKETFCSDIYVSLEFQWRLVPTNTSISNTKEPITNRKSHLKKSWPAKKFSRNFQLLSGAKRSVSGGQQIPPKRDLQNLFPPIFLAKKMNSFPKKKHHQGFSGIKTSRIQSSSLALWPQATKICFLCRTPHYPSLMNCFPELSKRLADDPPTCRNNTLKQLQMNCNIYLAYISKLT